jgi:hypothetical protein
MLSSEHSVDVLRRSTSCHAVFTRPMFTNAACRLIFQKTAVFDKSAVPETRTGGGLRMERGHKLPRCGTESNSELSMTCSSDCDRRIMVMIMDSLVERQKEQSSVR